MEGAGFGFGRDRDGGVAGGALGDDACGGKRRLDLLGALLAAEGDGLGEVVELGGRGGVLGRQDGDEVFRGGGHVVTGFF